MLNEIEKNNKLIIPLVFFIVLSLILGVFIVYDKLIRGEDDNKIVETDTSKKSSKLIILSDNCSVNDTDCKKYEVAQTSDGEVYVTVEEDYTEDNISNQLVESNVTKAFIVQAGMSDVGDGRIIVFIKEDGTISALSMSYLLLRKEVVVEKNIGDLKNIVSVFYEKELSESEYEPPLYRCYALDEKGNKIEITEYINKL